MDKILKRPSLLRRDGLFLCSRMNIIRNIPNFITLGNLLCGVLALLSHDTRMGCYLILLAAVLDFLDGLVARALNVSSPMGKELDSLADVVSFGVAPMMLLMPYMPDGALGYAALAIPLGAAWRLARFNIDTTQSDTFKGLPAPGNGMFWVGVLASLHAGWIPPYPLLLPIVALLLALFMVSTLRLLSFKFKHYGWEGNQSRYAVLLLAMPTALVGIAFGLHWLSALPLVILLYATISIIHFYILKKP